MKRTKIYIINCAQLISEWDYDKNNKLNLFPDKLTVHSNKKAWWKCKNNHSYVRSIDHKYTSQPDCPYCTNKRVLLGYNDIKTLYPFLAQEWNFEKNQDISIDAVVVGSAQKVWWKCSKCGHEWQTSIQHRTQRHTGCPSCAKNKIVESRQKTILLNNGHLNSPLLLEEWDYDKNAPLKPTDVTNSSSKSVYWICSKCEHSWKAKINNRSQLNRGCPLCSNQIVIKGKNDLATTHPNLANEWNFEKNAPLTPFEVTHGSRRKVWWRCSAGHEYQASILHRSHGTNCPICNSGRQTSFAEQAFLYYIKKLHPDTISRYKDIFNNGMELDIYIPSLKTAIEYDGIYWHKNKRKNEEQKYKICQEHGIKLIRVKESHDIDCRDIADYVFHIDNMDNMKNLNDIIIVVLNHLEMFYPLNKKYISSINLTRDSNEIRKYMTDIKDKSLSILNPELALEWHPTKNGSILPSMVMPNSSIQVWWKCKTCGHEWKTSVNHRANGTGCIVCYKNKNKGGKHSNAKRIYQYSISGDFIQEWDCISSASKMLGINNSNISMCANHKRNNAGGFRWEYFYADKISNIEKPKTSKKGRYGKAVVQIDANGIIVNEYQSLNAAASATSIDATSISKALHGHINKAGGYCWVLKLTK